MTALSYSLLIIQSSGLKTFSNLGRCLGKSADTIKRLLQPKSASRDLLDKIALHVFERDRELYLVVDDTLIPKIFSTIMRGVWWFFSSKDKRELFAFKGLSLNSSVDFN